jgi:hypothetical protein
MPTCSPTTADGRPCKDHAMPSSPNPNMLEHVFVKSGTEFIR